MLAARVSRRGMMFTKEGQIAENVVGGFADVGDMRARRASSCRSYVEADNFHEATNVSGLYQSWLGILLLCFALSHTSWCHLIHRQIAACNGSSHCNGPEPRHNSVSSPLSTGLVGITAVTAGEVGKQYTKQQQSLCEAEQAEFCQNCGNMKEQSLQQKPRHLVSQLWC